MKKKTKSTIKDVAIETGLSIATISRIINETGSHYSERTEKIVRDAIKKLDYKPNIIARHLKKRKTNMLGFIVPELDSFYSEVFLGAQDAALKYKYSNFLCNTNYNRELEEIYLENLLNRQVDGVIFTTGLLNNSLIYKFIEIGTPVVAIEKFLDDPAIPSIILDNYQISKETVKHLINNGYRRIGYISAPLKEMHVLNERYKGYRDALRENGLKFEKSIVYFDKSIRGEWDLSISGSLIEKIMSRSDHPDALFIISDSVAMAAMKIIKKIGYKIPEDIGIVGFDDRRVSKYLDPPLTSIYQPKYDMGYKGTELLIKIIEDEKIENRNIQLNMKLSIRQSSNRKLSSSEE